jgi:hypothetical protein
MIKRNGNMLYVKPKRSNYKKCKCNKCGKELTPSTAYYYVDGCNCAITENAPPHCKECYIKTYKY